MIDQVTEAAQQVSSESDNVSAAAEEQTSSMAQVANHAETLADRADELRTELAQFTIDVDSDSTPADVADSEPASRPDDPTDPRRDAGTAGEPAATDGSGRDRSFTGDVPGSADPSGL